MIRNGFYIIKDSIFFGYVGSIFERKLKNKIDHTTIVLKIAIIMEYIG